MTGTIVLHVDLTDAPRHILHAHETIPVSAGPLELEYPKWIPGDHRPTGPIDNLAGLFIRANGQEIPWRRDEVDMYGVHLTVPEGVNSLDVSYDFLAVPGGTGSDEDDATSANMAVLEWNSVVIYPANIPVMDIPDHGQHHGSGRLEFRHRTDANIPLRQRDQLRDGSRLHAGRFAADHGPLLPRNPAGAGDHAQTLSRCRRRGAGRR